MHALCPASPEWAFLGLVAKRGPARAHVYESDGYRDLRARFTANLRRIRAAREWTQEECAERYDMTMQQFQHLEAGDANVTFATLAPVAKGLGVDVAELLAARRRR